MEPQLKRQIYHQSKQDIICHQPGHLNLSCQLYLAVINDQQLERIPPLSDQYQSSAVSKIHSSQADRH